MTMIEIKFYPHKGVKTSFWCEETAILCIDEISHIRSSEKIQHGSYSTTGNVITMKNGEKFCTPEKVEDIHNKIKGLQ